MKLAIHKSIAALIAITASSMPAAAQLRVEKRATAPVILGPGQAAIVIGFRRPDKKSSNKAGSAAFSRYDPIKREVIFQPKNAKKNGDKNTYWVMVKSEDKTLTRDSAVMVVSAGDYVLFSAMPGTIPLSNTFCLGAPIFHVDAGETVYFGDFTPYTNLKLVDGERTSAMAYSTHVQESREELAKSQPALARTMKPAVLHNQATYGCVASMMSAYEVPGVEALAPAGAAARGDEPAVP